MISFNKMQSFLTPTKQNFLWLITGNGIYALCQWGMLVVLAKLGNPHIVGQFAFALAIISPVIMITNMQLRDVQATDAGKEYFLTDYMAVRMISTFSAIFIIALILYIGHFERSTFLVISILFFAKSVESFSDVFYGFFQQHEKMFFMAKSMIIKGIFSVVVLFAVFRLSSNLPWALFGIFCSWILVLILYDCRNGRYLLREIGGPTDDLLITDLLSTLVKRRKMLIRIVTIAFPLGIVMGIVSLNVNVPRYAIEKYLGTRDLGIFSALAYITVAFNMFIIALGQAVTPRMARDFASKNIPAFKRLLKKMILINFTIGLIGTLVIFAAGKKILTIIYTQEYAAYPSLFVALMIATTLFGIASAFGYAMTAARQFDLQVPLFLAVLVSTLMASFILIPNFKLFGAAMALIISALVQISGGIFVIVRAMRNK